MCFLDCFGTKVPSDNIRSRSWDVRFGSLRGHNWLTVIVASKNSVSHPMLFFPNDMQHDLLNQAVSFCEVAVRRITSYGFI